MHKGFSFLMREAHNRRHGPSSTSISSPPLEYLSPKLIGCLSSCAQVRITLHTTTRSLPPPTIFPLPHITKLPDPQSFASSLPPQHPVHQPSIPKLLLSTTQRTPLGFPATRSSPRPRNGGSPTRSAGIRPLRWVVSWRSREREERGLDIRKGPARLAAI
jgi:hypothetical protein